MLKSYFLKAHVSLIVYDILPIGNQSDQAEDMSVLFFSSPLPSNIQVCGKGSFVHKQT